MIGPAHIFGDGVQEIAYGLGSLGGNEELGSFWLELSAGQIKFFR
jgi:hypothetical protein